MEIKNAKHTLAVEDSNLAGSAFRDVNLSDSTFADANLSKAVFTDINLSGAKFHNIDLTGVEISDGDLAGMKIDGIPVQDALDAYRRTMSNVGSGATARPGLSEIRIFRDDDKPAVIALWKSVFGYGEPHNDPAEVVRQKVEADPDLLLVAIRNGKVVGTVMGGYDGHRGWIYSLAVDPECRECGIGMALVGTVERALAGRGCIKVNLQLLATNVSTVAFYAKLGYRVEDRISMGKLLK